MTPVKSNGATFSWFSSRAATVLPTVFLLGCVNLDKPESVKNCAGRPEGCSDYPTPKSDASDGQKASPDGKLEDSNGTSDVGIGSPDAGADRFSSPEVADAIIRRDSAPVPIDGMSVDAGDTQGDLLLDLPVLLDGASPDEGAELDLGDSDLTGPADAVEDSPSEDLAVDVTPLDTQPDVQVNCVAQIVSNGYKAGTAAPCSDCHDNNLPLATNCTAMIDCLAPKPAPRSADVFRDCLNVARGSDPVNKCVTALVKAGCPNGY